MSVQNLASRISHAVPFGMNFQRGLFQTLAAGWFPRQLSPQAWDFRIQAPLLLLLMFVPIAVQDVILTCASPVQVPQSSEAKGLFIKHQQRDIKLFVLHHPLRVSQGVRIKPNQQHGTCCRLCCSGECGQDVVSLIQFAFSMERS